MNFKKLAASVVLSALAVATGVTVGKEYIDSNIVNDYTVNATEEELREADSTVSALASKADSGASVMSFNAIELYLIAENNLQNCDFLKEMLGTTNSASVELDIRSQRIKYGDILTYYKLSPSKTVPVVNITTPNIATKTVFNYNSQNKIVVSTADKTCFTNTSSAATLNAVFSSSSLVSQKTYTKDEYYEEYSTTPDSSLLPYIISTKTCDENNYSAVTDNGDGTYSFSFSFSGGEDCAYPALYYKKEITSSSGYTNAKLAWTSISFTVTIDSSFRFKTISYYEVYTLGADDLPLSMTSTTVKDNFVETFYYDEDEILSRAIDDYISVLGGE